MRVTETVTLGDFQYKISQLPYKKARSLLIRLTNLLGPALGQTVTAESVGSGQTDVSVDERNFGEAIRTLATAVSEEDLDIIQNQLFSCTSFINKTGHEVPLDPQFAQDHFDGARGLARALKLTGEALRVNYADFLEEMGLGGLFQTSSLPDGPLN